MILRKLCIGKLQDAQDLASMLYPWLQGILALYNLSRTGTPLTNRKGGDDTFGGFPEHLRALVSHALPKTSVKAVTYPKYETRGDLYECVGRFREW